MEAQPSVLVHHFLENSARRTPDKVALVCAGRQFTYIELDTMSNRMAHAFRQRGVSRGDRVAVYLNNSVEAVVAIFGVLKAGGVFIVINRTTKVKKLIYILSNCRASGLVTDARALATGLGDRLLADVPWLSSLVVCGDWTRESSRTDPRWQEFAAIQAAFYPERPSCNTIDLDLACLVYTSGTTGEPKGVMCDHSNVVFVSDSVIQSLRNVDADIVLNVLPLSFGYGLYQLLMALRFGGTLVLENSFAFPTAILQRVEEYRVTGLPGVPTLFATLLQMDLRHFDLSSLRYITNAGAALPPNHVLELRRRFPGVALYSMYGLTETKRALYLPPDLLAQKPDSVGVPIPGTEAWIQDETGRRLGPGEVGELVVRGRHVMRGYWEDPESTAARFRPGQLPGERLCYTGDLFGTDEDGCMYFVGRVDDIIKSRGEKVAPREVENVLHALDGVAQAVVVGVPDGILGYAIKALIVPSSSDLTAAKVIAHCKAHLEDFMVPTQVEFRETFPKSPSGKICRSECV